MSSSSPELLSAALHLKWDHGAVPEAEVQVDGLGRIPYATPARRVRARIERTREKAP
jgi:hypothetical protein